MNARDSAALSENTSRQEAITRCLEVPVVELPSASLEKAATPEAGEMGGAVEWKKETEWSCTTHGSAPLSPLLSWKEEQGCLRPEYREPTVDSHG